MQVINSIIVGIGDFKVGYAPSVIKTTLGSCIAICLYDPTKKVGGMLHIMLANSSTQQDKPSFKRAKYADTGIADLLDSLHKTYQVSASSFYAKIFGGAKMLAMVTQDIGKENEAATRAILKNYNIQIVAAKTGGTKGYQVDFNLETGLVQCRVFGQDIMEF